VEYDLGQRISHSRGSATAAQELAFTLRDGIEYVQWGVDAGRPSMRSCRACRFSHGTADFFEEIAKYRAAAHSGRGDARPFRRDERAFMEAPVPRQTAGVSLTSQQPYNNWSARRCRRWPLYSAGPIAAHQFPRQALALRPRKRHPRAPDPADHRVRNSVTASSTPWRFRTSSRADEGSRRRIEGLF